LPAAEKAAGIFSPERCFLQGSSCLLLQQLYFTFYTFIVPTAGKLSAHCLIFKRAKRTMMELPFLLNATTNYAVIIDATGRILSANWLF
jgi:hypothetical protein